MSKQCCVWDIRVSEEKISQSDLANLFKRIAKKWTFQLEKGEQTGYLHYQCRVSLKTVARENELHKRMDGLEAYITPTSNANRNNNFYVTKDETRIGGPWKDDDPYIPRQIREITHLRYWQLQVVESAKKWETRQINIVYDEKGNHGKTILKTYIGCHKIGRALPFCNDYRDLLRIIMDTPKMPLYIIDIPRALNKDKLFQFFSAIETLKDGYAYDDRYHFREEYFDCPQIWVFMNVIPELNMLSSDRWVFWQFTPKGNLENFKPEPTKIDGSLGATLERTK